MSQRAPDLGDGPSRGRAERSRFVGVAFALLVLLIGANMPSPLYPGYERDFGFPPVTLTLVFATYVATLVPSLCLAAPLADTLGYRRVLVPALACAAVAMGLFAAARGVGWLYAARAVQGVAVGAAAGTLTSALLATAPSGNRTRASLLATLTTTAGNGIGPVLAGLSATYLPQPTRLCYVIEIALLLVASVAVMRLSGELGRLGDAWRPRVPAVPARARARFRVAAAVSALGWAVTALCLAQVPSYLAAFAERPNLVLAGLASGMILLAASVTQLLARTLDTRKAQAFGLLVLVAGVVGLLPAGAWRSSALVLACSLVAGVGQGLAFMGAMRQVNETSTEAERSGVIAAFYTVTYLAFGVPVIGVGLLATVLDTTRAVQLFALAFVPLSLLTARRAWRS
ncbi:MFS transporter [Pseudonocardia acaciae]|uniref:MFS transporter n=1 Tax=Pseudonocardia acaciae TaxID=551276 RepID=UPI0005677CCD|nr:MFS transporter [Pseudonocardia acaciae]